MSEDPESKKKPITESSPVAAANKHASPTAAVGGTSVPATSQDEKKTQPTRSKAHEVQTPSEIEPKSEPMLQPVATESRLMPTKNASMSATDSTEAENESFKPESFLKRLWKPAIGGTIILSIVSSAIWESAVKPGLSHFGRFMLNALTLGSDRIRDEAYRSAAMDPTGVPSLQALENTTFFMILLNILLLFLLLLVRRAVQALNNASQEHSENTFAKAIKSKEQPQRVFHLVESKIFIGFVALWLASSVFTHIASFFQTNQSVLIWRVFQTNMTILAPALEPQQEKTFRAKFASMKTKADFMGINKDMHEVGNRSRIVLSDVETW